MSESGKEPNVLGSSSRKSVSLIEGLREGYFREPYKMLITSSYESMTYADAYFRSLALTACLRENWNLNESSTVLLSANNVCWYVVVVTAVQMCGSRLVLLTGTAENGDFDGAIAAARPDLVIVSSFEHEGYLRSAYPNISLAGLGYGSNVPRLEGMVSYAMTGGVLDEPAYVSDSEIALFSSGSTGAPKAIVNRSSSFLRSGLAQARVLGARPDDVCYIPVPFSHTYGMVSIYTAVETGCTIVTNAKYRPDVSVSTISATRATLYFGVPTMYLRELSSNSDGAWDLSSLRAGLVAGSTCPESVFEEYEQRYGCVLAQCYGMTETAATLTTGSLDEPAAVRASSVGRPIEGAEVRIDAETGEILCKTPSLMSGVLRPDGTLDRMLDEKGWFHSGDVGAIDEAGRLSITGRIKDIIIRGGINIFPAEVENAYQGNEAVSLCCLVGYPDAELGERSCLCVVLQPGCDVSAFDLRSYAKGRVEKCKIPDVVLKMDDLPRLGNGKIDKKTLKAHVPALLERARVGSSPKGRMPR